MSRNFIYRHHGEPRVKLYSPREESFLVPLKYIDVSRTTHTNLDVKQERRIDDYWNINGSRDVSDSWTGFTQFTLLDDKPPDGYMWSGVRLTRKQLTSRPDHLWPELWIKMGRNVKLKERQKWSHEKLQLDDARKLRGIYFIDPEDKEFKETIKNVRKKLETPVAPAMPCKISKNNQIWVTRGKSSEITSKLAFFLEASECTRLRMEESLPNYHEDHIAGNGDNSLHHYNLVHKFIPMPQYSTEIHWRNQNCSYKLGWYARATHRWLLEYRWVSRLVWSLDRFHTMYSIGRKSSWRIHVVRGEINEKTAYIQARSSMAKALEINGKARQAQGEATKVV